MNFESQYSYYEERERTTLTDLSSIKALITDIDKLCNDPKFDEDVDHLVDLLEHGLVRAVRTRHRRIDNIKGDISSTLDHLNATKDLFDKFAARWRIDTVLASDAEDVDDSTGKICYYEKLASLCEESECDSPERNEKSVALSRVIDEHNYGVAAEGRYADVQGEINKYMEITR